MLDSECLVVVPCGFFVWTGSSATNSQECLSVKCKATCSTRNFSHYFKRLIPTRISGTAMASAIHGALIGAFLITQTAAQGRKRFPVHNDTPSPLRQAEIWRQYILPAFNPRMRPNRAWWITWSVVITNFLGWLMDHQNWIKNTENHVKITS